MKFTVASSDLQKALAKVSGVVPSKSTLPILENILFSLSKNTLTLLATDLEVSMSVSVEVKGEEEGVLAMPAKRVLDTVRALPEVQIHLHADETSKKIQMVTPPNIPTPPYRRKTDTGLMLLTSIVLMGSLRLS